MWPAPLWIKNAFSPESLCQKPLCLFVQALQKFICLATFDFRFPSCSFRSLFKHLSLLQALLASLSASSTHAPSHPHARRVVGKVIYGAPLSATNGMFYSEVRRKLLPLGLLSRALPVTRMHSYTHSLTRAWKLFLRHTSNLSQNEGNWTRRTLTGKELYSRKSVF